MITDDIMEYTNDGSFLGDGVKGSNFIQIQKWLGKRPGDYNIDPYYLRTAIGNKPFFWDQRKKSWKLVRMGAKFYFDNDGIPVMEAPK